MISASEFRNGVTLEYDGDIFVILEFQHVKPGKGAAFVRAKIRNLITGATIERTFRPSEKMNRAHIDRKDLEFLYEDSGIFYFMDQENYEQTMVNASDIGDALKFVKPNDTVKLLIHNGKVFGVEPPTFVELEVIDTEPGFRGDTATNVMKPAKVETGAQIMVPLFVNVGDRIKIDTRTEDYLGRAQN